MMEGADSTAFIPRGARALVHPQGHLLVEA